MSKVSKDKKQLSKSRWNLRFDATRSALYHMSREGMFSTLHKLVMFVVTFSGTGAAFNVLQNGDQYLSIGASLLAAFVATLDLVYDFNGKARLHSTLKQQYYNILSELEICADGKSEISMLRSRMIKIYADEPPKLWALDAIAWNRTYTALYPKTAKSDLLQVTWWQRLVSHFWAFSAGKFGVEDLRSSETEEN